MGFDLYLASYDDSKIMNDAWENDWPLLYSQINNRGCIINRLSAPTNGKLLIDSGAHSAHTKGITLDLEEYIGNETFVKHFKDVIDYRVKRFYKERLEKVQLSNI